MLKLVEDEIEGLSAPCVHRATVFRQLPILLVFPDLQTTAAMAGLTDQTQAVEHIQPSWTQALTRRLSPNPSICAERSSGSERKNLSLQFLS